MPKIAVKRLSYTAGLALILMSYSPTAMADSSPFNLIKGYKAEIEQSDYVKLNSNLTLAQAKKVDAKFTKKYGEPKTTREGLKVWEVPNPKAKQGEADMITIMCGREDDGFFVVIDSRGSGLGNMAQKATRKSSNNRSRKAYSVSQSNNISSVSRLKPEERD